jgi:hypothetical protein
MQSCFVREINHLFPVVFCVCVCVHKLDFMLVTNETPNKWRQVKRSCNDTHIFDRIYTFSPGRSRKCKRILSMLCESIALSRAKTLVHRFVTRSACRTNM